MNHSTPTLATIGALLVVASSTASGQTSFPEVEPNGPKAEATPAVCMIAGDTLDGTTTGTSTTAANTALTSADTFLVQTCALTAGIYVHELVITTSGTAGHAGTIRGLNQTGTVGVGGTAGTVDSTAQTSSTATVPPRMNRWFGFGRGEQLYYRVTGATTTTAPYVATLSTTALSPLTIGPFAAGSITVTTVGQGHSTDTEIALYDATLTAIPGALNDDHFAGATLQSALTRTLTPGRYYLAVTRFNFADNRTAAADDDWVSGTLLDFADIAADSNSGAVATDVAFAVTDIAGTTPVAATLTSSYGMIWYKFDLTSSTAGTPFCEPGVGGVGPCVCANPNGVGLGCANTGSGGANMSSAGNASLGADATDPGSVTLTGVQLLSGSTCIFLQGGAPSAGGLTFGAGIRCADGALKRLYTKSLVGFGGVRTAPEAADLSISNRSAALGDVIPAGGVRYYQIYYRDPFLPNPGGACPAIATFNISRGQVMTWAP